MKFTKMHGLGNDYIYLNCMEDMPEDPASLARKLSDRHFGVGGDGLICVCPSQTGDFAMRMFNADGSEGEMCGNGIRCLGKYVYDKGLTSRTTLRIETLAGMRQVCLRLDQGEVIEATVDMGKPAVGASRTVFALGRSYRGTPASMGNPHFVVETEHLKSLDLAEVGSELERLPCFPGGTNVEFVRVRNPLGAGQWGDPGLRHRSVCGGSSHDGGGTGGAIGPGLPAGGQPGGGMVVQ